MCGREVALCGLRKYLQLITFGIKEENYMSENLNEMIIDEMEPELDITIIEKRIKELEIKQQDYQKEVDEKFSKIFQSFGL